MEGIQNRQAFEVSPLTSSGTENSQATPQEEAIHLSLNNDQLHIGLVRKDPSLPSGSILEVDSNKTMAENAKEFHDQNKYEPERTGIKTTVRVNDHVSVITDVGKINDSPTAKFGLKYHGERLSAYAAVDTTNGDMDAGAKYLLGKKKDHYVLLETNKLYNSDSQFHRFAFGGTLLKSDTGKLQYKGFLGYMQGVELRSRYTEGGDHDLGIAGAEVKGDKEFRVTDRLSIELAGRSRITGGTAVRLPEGTAERLEFSQNGNVKVIPILDTPIDYGISAGLFTSRNEARVGMKVKLTESLTVRPYVDSHVTPGTGYTPIYHIAGGAVAEYQVSSSVGLEAGVNVPIKSTELYQPISVGAGIKVSDKFRLGGYVGFQDGNYASAGGQISYDHNGHWSIYGNIGDDNGYLSAFTGFRFNFDGPGSSKISVETYHQGTNRHFEAKPVEESRPPVPGSLANASWEDTVKALNSPEMLAGYDRGFITYDRNRGPGTYTPKEVYEKKSGVCRDHSRFQASILKTHGYQAYILTYGGAAVNHAIVAYIDKDGTWNALEYGKVYKARASSFEELTTSLRAHFATKKGYEDINWLEVGLVEPDSLQNVFSDRSPTVHEAINRGFDSELKY